MRFLPDLFNSKVIDGIITIPIPAGPITLNIGVHNDFFSYSTLLHEAPWCIITKDTNINIIKTDNPKVPWMLVPGDKEDNDRYIVFNKFMTVALPGRPLNDDDLDIDYEHTTSPILEVIRYKDKTLKSLIFISTMRWKDRVISTIDDLNRRHVVWCHRNQISNNIIPMMSFDKFIWAMWNRKW